MPGCSELLQAQVITDAGMVSIEKTDIAFIEDYPALNPRSRYRTATDDGIDFSRGQPLPDLVDFQGNDLEFYIRGYRVYMSQDAW